MRHCSGCVTTAEVFLLEKQSLEEFLSNVETGKIIIVSVSPQSRASLAVHFGISPLQVRENMSPQSQISLLFNFQ